MIKRDIDTPKPKLLNMHMGFQINLTVDMGPIEPSELFEKLCIALNQIEPCGRVKGTVKPLAYAYHGKTP